MDYPAEEEIVETKGFLRHPLLAIAVWMLGGNNDSSNKTVRGHHTIDADTESCSSNGSLCDRQSSGSSDLSCMWLSSVEKMPTNATPSSADGNNPVLLLPKVLAKQAEDVSTSTSTPPSENWGWYVSTGTPQTQQFSST